MSNDEINNLFNRLEKLIEEIRQIEQKVGKEEEKEGVMLNKLESLIGEENKEIGKSEQDLNIKELRKALEDYENLLEGLKEGEQLEDHIIKDLESEEKDEEEAEKIVEKLERLIISEFNSSFKNLKQILSYLENADEGLDQDHYNALEKDLAEFRDAAEKYYKLLELQEELVQEIEGTVGHVKKEEILEQELGKIIEAEEKELSEMIEDFRKAKDEEDYKEAEFDAEELEKLIQHYENEDSEKINIERELLRETEEMKELLKGDKELIEDIEESIELLDSFREMIETGKGIGPWQLGGKDTAREIDKELNQTESELENILEKVQEYGRELEKEESKIKDETKKISEMSQPAGEARKNVATAGKTAGIAGGAAGIFIFLFFVVMVLGAVLVVGPPI